MPSDNTGRVSLQRKNGAPHGQRYIPTLVNPVLPDPIHSKHSEVYKHLVWGHTNAIFGNLVGNPFLAGIQ